MNATIKGAIAAGAALVLLGGGLGTYAYWADEAPIAGGTITSGFLSLDVQNAVWSDITSGTAVVFDPAVDRIVPGDVIRYTADAAVDGGGRNLEASLLADTSTIGGDLTPYIDIAFTVDSITTDDLVYDLGSVEGPETHTIDLTFTFDPGVVFDEAMNQDLSLDTFVLTLEQNPNP